MSNIEDLCYEGEDITLKGKKRTLLYTNKGMKILARKFGTVMKGPNSLTEINSEMDEDTLDKVAILLHAGLVHEDPELTLDDVDNMINFGTMAYCIETITRAVEKSLPQVVGNVQSQPEK